MYTSNIPKGGACWCHETESNFELMFALIWRDLTCLLTIRMVLIRKHYEPSLYLSWQTDWVSAFDVYWFWLTDALACSSNVFCLLREVISRIWWVLKFCEGIKLHCIIYQIQQHWSLFHLIENLWRKLASSMKSNT